ncbi:MAG: CoA transferase, partial [Flavobacteriales bacterium]
MVELATVLAGPSVGMFLAELGCKVIKFEPPHGDVTRSWKSKDEFPNKNISAYYASVNYGKEIRTLDLRTGEG